MKKTLKWTGIVTLVTIVINLILAIISTILPIQFLKPVAIVEGPKVFYNLSLGLINIPINQTLVTTWILMILIILFLLYATQNLSVENPGTMQVILEELYNFIDNQFLAEFGKYKKIFMPFFSALFSFLLLANLSGFLFPYIMLIQRKFGQIEVSPFFRAPTADINTTVGLALVVTVTFIGAAIYKKGVIGLFKDLSQPFVLMFPINLIGEIAKPINISMRLFGNMFAGLVIIGLLYGMSFNGVLSNWTNGLLKGSFSFAVLWPAFLQIYLDLFIGLLQAFVFTVLSSVYIGQNLIDEDEI